MLKTGVMMFRFGGLGYSDHVSRFQGAGLVREAQVQV